MRQSDQKEIALFGGSFNPPHVGHVMVCTWLLSTRLADEVWLVPTFQHPFAKDLASFEDRVTMCEAAASIIPGGRIRVSRIEEELGGTSYTVNTVEALKAKHPEVDFELVVGSDLLDELPSWHQADRLQELVTLRVVHRGGFEAPEGQASPEFPKVSSSRIRALLGAGEGVRPLVPAGVLAHIEKRELYHPKG